MTNHYVDNKHFTEILSEWADRQRERKLQGLPRERVTDAIGESVLMICNNLANHPKFMNYCVDTETEALTQRGWLRYTDITLDDNILSYDKTTKCLVWSRIEDIYIGSFKGKMHKLKMKGLDALVSPKHKFLTNRDLVEVELLLSNDNIILMGNHLESIDEIYSDSFVELVGWVITEGYLIERKRAKNIILAQNEGHFADMIRKCFNELGVPFKEYYRKNGLVTWFLKHGDICKKIHDCIPGKVLSSEFILSLSQRQRELLIDTMVSGDGWVKKCGGYGYAQKDKNHIDQFLFLCTIAGKTTKTTHRKIVSFGKNTTIYNVNIYKKSKTHCIVEHIDFNGGFNSFRGGNAKHAYKEKYQNVPTIDYDGNIWCPQTEYGCFVCRRRGTIYLTGNSFKEDMIGDAIENCIRYIFNFDGNKSSNAFNYVTTIAAFAIIRRIKKEKLKFTKHISYIKRIVDVELLCEIVNTASDSDREYYSGYLNTIKSVIDEFEKIDSEMITETPNEPLLPSNVIIEDNEDNEDNDVVDNRPKTILEIMMEQGEDL
jgi:hypothetical protein